MKVLSLALLALVPLAPARRQEPVQLRPPEKLPNRLERIVVMGSSFSYGFNAERTFTDDETALLVEVGRVLAKASRS